MMPLDLPRRGHVRPSGLWCPEAPDVVPARLAAGYVPGPVQRRRVLGAAAAWTPASEASCELWLDAGDASTRFQDTAGTIAASALNDPLGRLNDKSGKARHYTQPTTTKRGTVVLASSLFGGRDVVEFTTTQGLLAPASLQVTGAQTWFFVVRRTSVITTYGYGFTLYGGSTASAVFLGTGPLPPTTVGIRYTSGGYQIAGETADTTRHTTRITWDGAGQAASSYAIKRDGAAATLSATSFGADSNGGAINGDRSGTYGQPLQLAEFGMFSSVDSTLLANLDAFLAARYP